MDKKITVGLVQINNSFSGQNYLPLSVGVLQAYAQKNLKTPEDYVFKLPVYSRLRVAEAVDRLAGSDIVLFSTYVWNSRISLEVARSLKSQNPETIVFFGGPHVPERPLENEAFLRKYPFIDLSSNGEGEEPVLRALENVPGRAWEEVPSVSFINGSGKWVRTECAERIKELGVTPSPYIEGTFTPLMEANKDENWIGLWETNRGCPFACTFCDWGSAIQSKVNQFSLERLYGEVDWFARQKIEFVFCCDANFGILPRDIDIAKYVGQVKAAIGYPHALSVQNTKNATERAYQVQKILADSGLNKGVDIALQSVDPETLKTIKRGNISTDTYQELQRRFTRDGVETFTDVILGLPGETYESFSQGINRIIENGQHNRIQFNNLSILPNAEMGDLGYQREHGIEFIETKVVNIHGELDASKHEIFETQQLVIATKTLPRQDWVRVRVFSWMAALLYFNKIFQIPMTLAIELGKVKPKDIIELFLSQDSERFPTLNLIVKCFNEKAHEMQAGGPEFSQSREWLNIWWPTDEYVFIKLVVENRLNDFYDEAKQIISQYLQREHLSFPAGLLDEAAQLNYELIKKPFQKDNLRLELSSNIWEFYRSFLTGAGVSLEEKPVVYEIDRVAHSWDSWDDWCREVVWWGNKKGAYLYYANNENEPQLAGHY